MQKFVAFSLDENKCRTAYRMFELPQSALPVVMALHENADRCYRIEDLPAELLRAVAKENPDILNESFFEAALPIHELGYLDHNGRDLTLMLDGKKPLAVFSGEVDANIDEVTSQCFDKYVQSGLIVQRRFRVAGSRNNPDWEFIMFALPGEEWRMLAYELIYRNGIKYGFDKYVDSMFSELLGYSEEEIDAFMNLFEKQ